jgi:DnaJ-class molecular chaperone
MLKDKIWLHKSTGHFYCFNNDKKCGLKNGYLASMVSTMKTEKELLENAVILLKAAAIAETCDALLKDEPQVAGSANCSAAPDSTHPKCKACDGKGQTANGEPGLSGPLMTCVICLGTGLRTVQPNTRLDGHWAKFCNLPVAVVTRFHPSRHFKFLL